MRFPRFASAIVATAALVIAALVGAMPAQAGDCQLPKAPATAETIITWTPNSAERSGSVPDGEAIESASPGYKTHPRRGTFYTWRVHPGYIGIAKALFATRSGPCITRAVVGRTANNGITTFSVKVPRGKELIGFVLGAKPDPSTPDI